MKNVITLESVKNCTTYERKSNGSLPTNYWTQTTTWDEDFNPKTTTKN